MDNTEYAVDHLVAKRSDYHGTFYKVQWYVFSAEDNTWEPEGNILSNILHQFDQQKAKNLNGTDGDVDANKGRVSNTKDFKTSKYRRNSKDKQVYAKEHKNA